MWQDAGAIAKGDEMSDDWARRQEERRREDARRDAVEQQQRLDRTRLEQNRLSETLERQRLDRLRRGHLEEDVRSEAERGRKIADREAARRAEEAAAARRRQRQLEELLAGGHREVTGVSHDVRPTADVGRADSRPPSKPSEEGSLAPLAVVAAAGIAVAAWRWLRIRGAEAERDVPAQGSAAKQEPPAGADDNTNLVTPSAPHSDTPSCPDKTDPPRT